MSTLNRNRSFRGLLTLTCLLTTGCAVHRAPEGFVEEPACMSAERGARVSSEEIAWVLRSEPSERSALDAWCWAVGPAVWVDYRPIMPGTPTPDSVAVVSWNAEVGHGSLTKLIAELRSGALTGSPVAHFVLLLQEVHRTGGSVPAAPPAWAAMPRRVGHAEDPERLDVLDVARREGLALFYAPSMRNGRAGGGLPEDRGNAILSTLPIRDPVVVELPYERQRRVAVFATVEVLDPARQPVQLRVASVHLDNRARFGRIHRTLGEARVSQARAIAEQIPNDAPTIVGGDLNTWVPGVDEAVVQTLRAALPLPAAPPQEGTLELPSFLPRLRVDHLFFRLPAGWDAGYRVAASTYGSDHYPLLGWIHGASDDGAWRITEMDRLRE